MNINKKPLIVAGITRSGLTATMQMLDAGGYPALGQYPAYEPFQLGGIPWRSIQGSAVKLVDAQLQLPPRDMEPFRVIYLRRNIKQQAVSILRFVTMLACEVEDLNIVEAMGSRNRARALNRIEHSLRADYKTIDKWVDRQNCYRLSFEAIIQKPLDTAAGLADWITAQGSAKQCDPARMAAEIVKRGTRARVKPLELSMV